VIRAYKALLPDEQAAPYQANEAEKAKFRTPYFSVQFTKIEPK
jgi:hypothetical protein